jgi:hypothetical protein
MMQKTIELKNVDGGVVNLPLLKISRKHRKAVREKTGIDLYQEFHQMANSNEDIPIKTSVADAVMDVVYEGHEAVLDTLDAVSEMTLIMKVFLSSFGGDVEIEKKSEVSSDGTTPA